MDIMQLIERLEEIAERHPEAEVRFATQPSWPLAHTVRGVVDPTDLLDPEDVPEGPCPDHEVEGCEECLEEQQGPAIVWLVEGESAGYAPRKVWEVA